MRKRMLLNGLLASLTIILLVLASCATPTPQTIVETVVVKEQVTVMVEGTPQIKEIEKTVEKIVEVTPVPEGPVDIVYTYRAGAIPKDLQEVEDAINEILIPKINVRLKLDPVEAGVYNERMQLRMAANEECDIVFTAPWTNNYYLNVINGSLYPLEDLLPEYAPGLWASIAPSTWEAARVKGHIYAVINQQIWPKPWGAHVIKEFADKYNLDLDEARRFEDMEPFMQAVLDGEGGKVMPYCGRSVPFYLQYHGFTEMGSGDAAGISVKYNDPTVVNVFASEEWQEHAKMNRRWYLNGYVYLEDVPDLQEKIKANLCAYGTHVEKPTQAAELKARYGQEWIFKSFTDPLILDTGGATATLNGVCATSKNPEAAVKVLEMFNTNKEVYRLLSYGIEGKHWVWVDQDLDVVGLPEGKTDTEVGYSPNTDWMFGNQFNAPYRTVETALTNAWEETRRLNNSAVPHILLGFTFDSKPVENEIAQVQAVAAELCTPIINGWVDFDENYQTCLDKVKEAGIDAIIAEAQRQVDEFMASK